MANIEPFQPILEQIQNLIKVIKNEAGKSRIGKVPEKTEERLDQLGLLVDQFCKITDGFLKSAENVPLPNSGKGAEEVEVSGSSVLTPEEAKFFKKLSELEAMALAGQRYFEAVIQKEQLMSSAQREKSKKEAIKRKRRFRGAGGGPGGWTPI